MSEWYVLRDVDNRDGDGEPWDTTYDQLAGFIGYVDGPLRSDVTTDAEVEAAAAAMYETRDDIYDDTEWEDCDSADRERWYCYARAALEAARRTR